MDAKLMRYYRKKTYGGRTLLARIVDFIIFRLLIVFVVFLVLLYFSHSTTVSLLISVFITAALSISLMIFNRRRVRRYIEKDMQHIKEKCLLEALTFMNSDEYAAYLNKLFEGLNDITMTHSGFYAKKNGSIVYAFHNHPSAKCNVSDVLEVLRMFHDKPLILISLSDFSAEAKMLCAGAQCDVTYISGLSILELAAKKEMLPDEEAAALRAEKEMNASIVTLDKVKESTLSRAKVKRYMICGVIVTIWPLITGFQFYYPIIAVLCFVLAILAYRKSHETQETTDTGIS